MANHVGISLQYEEFTLQNGKKVKVGYDNDFCYAYMPEKSEGGCKVVKTTTLENGTPVVVSYDILTNRPMVCTEEYHKKAMESYSNGTWNK